MAHFGDHGNDSGRFQGVEGIAVTVNGDVIICDKENHRIQII